MISSQIYTAARRVELGGAGWFEFTNASLRNSLLCFPTTLSSAVLSAVVYEDSTDAVSRVVVLWGERLWWGFGGEGSS